MRRILLDTSALLTLRDDEPGAEQVTELLSSSRQSEIHCFGCFITLMEVFYRMWKDESENAGRLAYEQCLALPIRWIHETPELLEKAVSYKATYRLSLADAWIAACAELENATLVHKDPEFDALGLEQIRLPYKA